MPEPVESMEVPRSDDGGNGLPPDAPSVPPTPVASPEPMEPAKPAEPVVELFELPDGRKVDAETVAQEYKNLLSDYTRKSQELAKAKPPDSTLPTPTNPLADPNYTPSSYEEIVKIAEERAVKAIEAKEQARVDQQQAVENAVIEQLTEIKKSDPALNENQLFLHANKYGFRDLRLAHQNMTAMSDLAKNVQKTTANNIAKRSDPVSVSPGATGARPDPSQFGNARDYLRSLST